MKIVDGIRAAWRSFRATYGGTTTLERPADWLRDFVAWRANASGVFVTEDTALSLPAFYAVVHLIARTVGGLPKSVYRWMDNGRERLPEHPNTYLLNEPNAFMSGFPFWEAIVGHAVTTGNGFAWIERNTLGQIVSLMLLPPRKVRITWDRGTLFYVYQQDPGKDGSADPIVLRQDEVFHLRGFGNDGVSGYSLIGIAAEAIGLGLAQQSYAAGMFGNDTQLGAVLKTPNKLSDNARKNLKDSWEERKAHKFRMHILEEGLEVSRLDVPPIHAQMVEAGMFNVVQVCRLAGVPPHMVAALERATFSNIEHQAIEWVQYGVMPWALRIEEECNRKLFGPRRGRLYVHLNLDGLLRGDFKTRTEGYRTLVQAGIFTIDECREKEEMNPHPGGVGSKPIVQGAMMSLEDALEPPEPPSPPAPAVPPEPPDDGEATSAGFTQAAERLRPVFADAATRVVNREAKQIARVFDAKSQNRAEWVRWANHWHSDERRHIMDAFEAPIEAMRKTANDYGLTVAARLDGFLDGWQKEAIERTVGLQSAESVAGQVPRLADGMAAAVFDLVLSSASENGHAA